MLLQEQPSHRPGGHTRCCFARTAAPAAPVVSVAILGLVGIVGMAGAVGVFQVVVVLALRVLVGYMQGNGGAGGDATVYARQDLYPVVLLALGNDGTLARAAAV